jgi:hypothetical protein
MNKSKILKYLKINKKILTKEKVLKEIDRVWDQMNLNNKSNFAKINLSKFYSHPVWILNGIFSETDTRSRKHRVAIAKYIGEFFFKVKKKIRVADYGGGSGVLSKIIIKNIDKKKISCIDVIEPWPFDFFLNKLSKFKKIRFRKKFIGKYDVIILQSVLEHVNDPIDHTIKCIRQLSNKGIIIFGNDFYPIIKCHVPSTFYLRHIFNLIISFSGMNYKGFINNCEYCHVFENTGNFRPGRLVLLSRSLRFYGHFLNLYFIFQNNIKKKIYNFFKS